MQTIQYNDKTYTIISTAHVSKESIHEVKETIESLQPDAVAIELDQARATAIQNPNSQNNTDIKEIIKQKKTGIFLMNLILATYQKKLAEDLDTQVGAEMLQAIQSGQAVEAQIHYIDRDVQTTFNRLWRSLSFWRKMTLLTTFIFSLFEKDDIETHDIENLKQSDLLMETVKELDTKMPEISQAILHERNAYMAEKLKRISANHIVVVIGAAHAQGMIECFDQTHSLHDLNTVPPKKKWNIAGWIIPLLLFTALVLLTIKDPHTGSQQLFAWMLLSSTLSAIGGLLSFAHPLTILTAFLMTPIGIVSPVLAVGFFAGLCEAYFRSPNVQDFETLSEDVRSLKGWYRNKVLHILMVMLATNLMSTVGTLISGTSIFTQLF